MTYACAYTVCLSIYLSICLSIYLSIYLSLYVCVCVREYVEESSETCFSYDVSSSQGLVVALLLWCTYCATSAEIQAKEVAMHHWCLGVPNFDEYLIIQHLMINVQQLHSKKIGSKPGILQSMMKQGRGFMTL